MSLVRLVFWFTGAFLAAKAEVPLAILTEVSNTQVVRHRDTSRLVAVNGELLFDGDSLLIPDGISGSATFRVCAASGSSKTFRLTSGRATFQSGSVTGATETNGNNAPCLLPDVQTDPALGVMTERALDASRSTAMLSPSDLAKLTPADRLTLQTIDTALRRDPRDVAARVSRATLLQRNGLDDAATSELVSIGRDWPDEQWARTLGYTIATRKAGLSPGSGKLYAAVIGISKYQQPNIPALHYADADAKLFLEFMAQSRAQGFATDRVYLSLINENATAASVRNKLKTFFDQAQQSDSILLYIAAHGVGDNKSDNGYVVLYDTHIESNFANSLSMDSIRDLLLAESARVGHIFLFVDTCHANRIAPIKQVSSGDLAVAKTAKVVTNGKILAMYASGDNQFSFENARYGGGHGIFTYFLMRAMNITPADPDYKRADADGDGEIDAVELASYVEDSVKANTKLKQWPNNDVRIDRFDLSTKLPGLTIAPCCAPGAAAGGVGVLRDPTPDPRGIEWTSPSDVDERALWEEKSQQVLYTYLKGEEVPQTAADYSAGLEATERARALSGESLFLEARSEFFNGRLLLFSKSYDDAVSHLEKAIRMDPASPYAFNALGIAWLELGRYAAAEAAFHDAIRRAENWAYPRHNLALVYLQRGDYALAIATYRDAAQRDPQYSYLPYNLGLIYQRLNDEDEATKAYKLALKNAPNRAAPLVALGALMAEHGRKGKARDYYRQAQEILVKNPEHEVLLNLRHNEGVLEASSRSGLERARTLWQANIDEADYLPSRFALARAYATAGSRAHPDFMAVAIAQYQQIVTRVPENTGARIEYAQTLYRAHLTDDAIRIVEQGLQTAPADTSLLMALIQLRAGRAPQ